MSEYNKNEEYGEDIRIKTPFMTWFENFWYHYKWHSIAALFLIICILVCSLQMCTKDPIDFHLMYAGNAEIDRTSADGDLPAYMRLKNIFTRYASDFDGDGNTVLTLTTYFSLSPEEIEAADSNPATEVNHTLLSQDREALTTRLRIGEYYLCLVSPYVLESFGKVGDVSIFAPISQYAPAENTLEYYNEYAIKLSSTALYKNSPEVREILPADTLICIRINSAMGAAFGGAENAELYARAEAVLRRILGE